MSLRSILLEVTDSTKTCLAWLIVVCAVLCLTMFNGCDYNIKENGPTVMLGKSAVLRQQFGADTVCTKLPARDSVAVLGIDRSSFGQKWLVRTRKGDVGWIDASDIAVRQILSEGNDKGDTVDVKAEWSGSYVNRYSYTQSDGEEHSRSTKVFVPVFDGWDDYAYDRDAIAGICTQAKFEKKASGKTIDEVNSEFGRPVLFRVSKDGFEAQYAWKVFEPSTGQMWRPNVTFGKDSVASAVSFCRPTKRGAGWLKAMPLAPQIIDMPVTSLLLRSSRYVMLSDPMMGGMKKALAIAAVVLSLIASGFWLFLTASIPVLLMGFLLIFPPVFKFLNDTALKLLMLAVTLVSIYVWTVMAIAWGMFPFWSVFILLTGIYFFKLASSPLGTYPHTRCPKCRRLYTIEFDHRTFKKSEVKTGSDIVRGQLLGKRTEKWKTWTEVTTTKTYRSGRKEVSTSKENVRNHARDYNTYEFIDYKVTYRLDHYIVFYKCRNCGLVETMPDVEYTELSREQVGTHTAEVAGEEY